MRIAILIFMVVCLLVNSTPLLSADASIPELIETMRSEKWKVRKEAMFALSTHGGGEALGALIDAMDDVDPHLRLRAAVVLGWIGEDASEAIPRLIEGLSDRNPWVRLHSARALGEIGLQPDIVIPALIDALDDRDQMVRAYSYDALTVFIDEPEALDAIKGALADKNELEIFIAGEILRASGTENLPFLLGSLNSDDETVRASALDVIGRIVADQESIVKFRIDKVRRPLFRRVIRGKYDKIEVGKAVLPLILRATEDESSKVRLAAMQSLWAYQTDIPSAVPYLLAALDDETVKVNGEAIYLLKPYGDNPDVVNAMLLELGDESAFVRMRAASCFGLEGWIVPEAVPKLVSIARGGVFAENSAALEALGLMGIDGPGVASTFFDGLTHEDVQFRLISIKYIGMFEDGSLRMMEALIEATESDHTNIVYAALRSLGQIDRNAERVVPFLLETFRETEDFSVKSITIESLGNFGPDAEIAIPFIRGVWKSDPELKPVAMYTLFRIGDRPKERLETLISMLDPSEGNLNYLVIKYLGQLGPEAEPAVPALISMLTVDKNILWPAVRALGEIGPGASDALPALENLLVEYAGNPNMVDLIQDAIGRIEVDVE